MREPRPPLSYNIEMGKKTRNSALYLSDAREENIILPVYLKT